MIACALDAAHQEGVFWTCLCLDRGGYGEFLDTDLVKIDGSSNLELIFSRLFDLDISNEFISIVEHAHINGWLLDNFAWKSISYLFGGLPTFDLDVESSVILD